VPTPSTRPSACTHCEQSADFGTIAAHTPLRPSSPVKLTSCNVSMSLTLDSYAGVQTEQHPLHYVLDLSEERHPANPHLAGELTATYPEVFDPQHGRRVITNYPNQGALLTLGVSPWLYYVERHAMRCPASGLFCQLYYKPIERRPLL